MRLTFIIHVYGKFLINAFGKVGKHSVLEDQVGFWVRCLLAVGSLVCNLELS